MEIISWKEAKEKGLKHYFTGKPCKNGHISKRFVLGSRNCFVCATLNRIRWRTQNPEKVLLGRRKTNQKWKKRNKQAVNAMSMKRHAHKLKALPKWADLQAIKQFYLQCPKDYVVDHKIPLQGKLVSGLHVVENLQYLTKSENSCKNNKFDPLFLINNSVDTIPNLC
jgi:hypothetical protein